LYNFQRTHTGIDGLVPADRFFGAAPEMLRTLKERVAANALEVARNGAPKTPFYLTGNVGGRSFSVHAEGERLLLRRADGEPTEIDLTSPEQAVSEDPVAGNPEEEQDGHSGDIARSSISTPGPDIASPAELPEPVSTESSVARTDQAVREAEGVQTDSIDEGTPAVSGAVPGRDEEDESIPPFISGNAKRICESLLAADRDESDEKGGAQ
jgi:hypothetical protein